MRLLNLLAAAGMLSVLLPPCTARAAAATLGAIDVSLPPYSANTAGANDDTPAFQRALNAAAASGASVKVPAGQYRFTGTLSIPDQVALEGVSEGERSYDSAITASRGTVFLITGGAGSRSGRAFVTLGTNSSLRNVALYYPNQPQSTAPRWTAPTAYPPAISLTGVNGAVENVCGVNPYTFITSASLGATLRRLTGQPLFCGIRIDGDADPTGQSGVRLEDVHLFSTWDSHPAQTQWMKAHSTGFAVYRADEFALRTCSCTGYQQGFSFDRSAAGAAYGTLTSCSAVNCTQAIHIAVCAAGTGGGLVFDGGGFGISAEAAVLISNTNTGNVTFNSCRFFQSPGALVSNASAAGSVVSFLASTFDRWGFAAACVFCGDPAHSAAPSGKTRLLSCSFGTGLYQYTYTPGEAGVQFENNSTASPLRVQASVLTPLNPSSPAYTQINNF